MNNSQNGNKEKKDWSTKKSILLCSGVGIVAGIASYVLYEIFKRPARKPIKTNEPDAHELSHLVRSLRRQNFVVGDEACRTAVLNLVKKIDENFYQNQKVSDLTALRGLSSIKKILGEIYDIASLSNILREVPSTLTPAEKHQHFDKVKTLCFAKILTTMYIMLSRLWLYRIEINIIGRQRLPELVESPSEFKLSIEDLQRLQKETNKYYDFPETNCKVPTVLTNETNNNVCASREATLKTTEQKESSGFLAESKHFNQTETKTTSHTKFILRRRNNYHPYQMALFVSDVPDIGTAYEESNYVFLTSTCRLETYDGCKEFSNIIFPIVQTGMENIFPHHNVTVDDLFHLLRHLCDTIEQSMFPGVHLSESLNLKNKKDLAEILLPNFICDYANSISTTNPLDTDFTELNGENEQSHQNSDECKNSLINNLIDCSSLKTEDKKHFVHGCLAETRDILESPFFYEAYKATRKLFLSNVETLLLEKLQSKEANGLLFPLCRVLGRLCGISELILLETDGNEFDITMEYNNPFATIFSQCGEVEDLCGAVYLPSIIL